MSPSRRPSLWVAVGVCRCSSSSRRRTWRSSTEVLPPFLAAAEADPTFTFVDVNLKFDKPELRVTIDRERAQDQGISALRIAQTLQLALRSSVWATSSWTASSTRSSAR